VNPLVHPDPPPERRPSRVRADTEVEPVAPVADLKGPSVERGWAQLHRAGRRHDEPAGRMAALLAEHGRQQDREYSNVKVFLSSVIGGLESYRDAAADAITSLGCEVIRAEDLSAGASSAQEACLAGVRTATLTVVLLGERYGERQRSGQSATHEEYREARGRQPVLAFVQKQVDHEPAQAEFIREVQGWETGNVTADFNTENDLRRAVTLGLHAHLVSAASGPKDERELLALAERGVDAERLFQFSGDKPRVFLNLATWPRREVLRPSELEADSLARKVQKEARYGAGFLFASEAESSTELRDDWLVLSQDRVFIKLNATGDIVVRQAAVAANRRLREVSALIEEDVTDRLADALKFGASILDQIDPAKRLSHVAIVAALTEVGSQSWRTRDEHARSPNSGGHEMCENRAVVSPTPAVRTRAEIGQHPEDLADDLMVLLRRRLRQ